MRRNAYFRNPSGRSSRTSHLGLSLPSYRYGSHGSSHGYRGSYDPMSPGTNYHGIYGYGNDGHEINITAPTSGSSDSSDTGILRVKSVDLNVAENARAHHTDKYEITESRYEHGKIIDPKLVLRRGQPFRVDLTFDKPFQRESNDLKIVFEIGPQPKPSKGTSVQFLVSEKDLPKEWGAKIRNISGNTVQLELFSPPDCIVGKWDLRIDTVTKTPSGPKSYRYMHNQPAYMLFNPWAKDDPVFMPNERDREEYVLSDIGKIYRGTAKQIGAKPWNFGQFEDFMLDCCMMLLDQSGLAYPSRGDPVKLSRKISQVTNAPNDGGLLVGDWSGNYHGGTKPTAWAGSVRIFKQYWDTKKPVKFGQCWVFSGCVTTFCRCLGLPCRSVTNFASAHDSDGSITIDYHWDREGNPLDDMDEDSIWNFHVWNEAWMARPDLPSGYGGWQAIDSTPQELSEGVYCAGPCSVAAIKNGDVGLPHDGSFIFAEVNADQINWIRQADGSWHKMVVATKIGKNISTKAIGTSRGPSAYRSRDDPDREDVTAAYKFPEGSHEERASVLKANQASTKADIYEQGKEDVKFELEDKDFVLVGNPFDCKLWMTNLSSEERSIFVRLTVSVVYYTGVIKSKVKTKGYKLKLPAGARQDITLLIEPNDYMRQLVEQAMFKIKCMATIAETNQVFATSDDFRLRRPDLTVEAPDTVKVGQEFPVEILLTNPLPCSLTHCEFTVEGPGLQHPVEYKHNNVGPGMEAKIAIRMTPRRPGERTIVATFESQELPDISGATVVNVNP